MPKPSKCPKCKKPSSPEKGVWPFCSERCKSIDFYNWTTEAYRVPSEEGISEEAELPNQNQSDEDS